jgi:hypothetical protein
LKPQTMKPNLGLPLKSALNLRSPEKKSKTSLQRRSSVSFKNEDHAEMFLNPSPRDISAVIDNIGMH